MKTIITITILLLACAGCGTSTHITRSWKQPGAVPKDYKKIVVLALVHENREPLREKMEQHLADDLKALGYDAVCSCNEYNPKAFDGLTEKEAVARLHQSGVGAVLTIVLLSKTKEKFYVPARVLYSPYSTYQNNFMGYYRTMHSRVYSEGYYTLDTQYFWESNLYDIGTNELLYSAQSQSFDPGSTESLGHEYGQMIIRNMQKNNILAAKR